MCESEYAEINDSGLPRYTDIFKEAAVGGEDPFTRATAPPMCTYEARGDSDSRPRDLDESNVKEVLQGTADILQRESQQQQQQRRQSEAQLASVTREDIDYYNVAGQSQGQGQGQVESCAVREDSVLSLTKDDPAVVTGGGASSPSSPSHPHPHPDPQTQPKSKSSSCDVNAVEKKEEGEEEDEGGKARLQQDKTNSSASAYESLSRRGEKDDHEYQRLSSRNGRTNDMEMNGVSSQGALLEEEVEEEEEEEEVGFAEGEGSPLSNHQAQEAADC